MKNLKVLIPESQSDTSAMREYAESLFDGIENVLENEHLKSVVIVLKTRKSGKQKLELTLNTDKHSYRREVSGSDYYELLPEAVVEIEKAIYSRRDKRFTIKKRRGQKAKREIEEENLKEFEIDTKDEIREKVIMRKPVYIEEAIMEMEDLGHDFYLFLDAADEKTCVVYKRKDGGYGVLRHS